MPFRAKQNKYTLSFKYWPSKYLKAATACPLGLASYLQWHKTHAGEFVTLQNSDRAGLGWGLGFPSLTRPTSFQVSCSEEEKRMCTIFKIKKNPCPPLYCFLLPCVYKDAELPWNTS